MEIGESQALTLGTPGRYRKISHRRGAARFGISVQTRGSNNFLLSVSIFRKQRQLGGDYIHGRGLTIGIYSLCLQIHLQVDVPLSGRLNLLLLRTTLIEKTSRYDFCVSVTIRLFFFNLKRPSVTDPYDELFYS